MTELCIGMPLLDVIELTDSMKIDEKYKKYILNFCRQELEYGDSIISNEIELSMLQAWFNNSDKINMPELLSDNYKLVDVYTEKYENYTKIYEEFATKDNTYYLRCITRDKNGTITEVYIQHKSTSIIDMLKNGGTQDFLTDKNHDGIANSRTIIKKQKDNTVIISDINLDGQPD